MSVGIVIMKKARSFVPGLFVALLCFSARAETNSPLVEASKLSDDLVRVEIFEGLPDRQGWDFMNPPLNETYSEPAFGFVTLPTKYSSRGIKVDRKAPFLLRASAKVTLPKGEQRIF